MEGRGREMALALESVNERRVDNHLVSLGTIGTSEAGWLVHKHEHPLKLDMPTGGFEYSFSFRYMYLFLGILINMKYTNNALSNFKTNFT